MNTGKLRRMLFPLLYPFSLAYGLVTEVRNRLFDLGVLKSEEFSLPVISVGNLTAGGTGKTPHVEYLLKLLSETTRVAYLSRGYKRKTRGFQLADDSDTALTIGDEALQVYRKFSKVTVAVDEDRVHGIRELLKTVPAPGCILLDDAFQHRSIKAGISILLTDFRKPLHRDHLLPAGNLRESTKGIRRASMVIVSKVPDEYPSPDKQTWIRSLQLLPSQHLFFTGLQYNNLVSFCGEPARAIPLEELKKRHASVLLATGIADPFPLACQLSGYCSFMDHMIFPDHHIYNQADVRKISRNYAALEGENKFVITTEKDAVKLEKLIPPGSIMEGSLFYLPVSVRFLYDTSEQFNAHIHSFVEKNS